MTSNMSEFKRLAYRYIPAHSSPEAPLVVFAHGFLGAGDDWDAITQALPDYHQLTIDLPGHGKSCPVQGVSFDQVCRMITATILDCIQAHKLSATVPVCLVGYSLGARLLMYLMTKHRATDETINELNVSGLVIEGAILACLTMSKKPRVGLVIANGLSALSRKRLAWFWPIGISKRCFPH